MYTLVRARNRSDRRAGRWQEADLQNVPVTTLTTVYGEVLLYIEYPGPGIPHHKALYFDKVTELMNGVAPTVTVQEWLDSLGGMTLPFEDALPNETIRLVKYVQAWHGGYNIKPKGRNLNVDSQQSKFVKEDLVVTHPTHDYLAMDDYTLWTVNGYFHMTDASTAGLVIYDGNTSLRKANNNQIGAYSFETIGKLKKYPIKPEYITAQKPGAPLVDACYITLPSTIDITNKTVLLVTGGYLQVLSSNYMPVGERTWRLSLGGLMVLDRYIQSLKELDLSSLNLVIDEKNPTLLSVAQLRSDETVMAYLTLTQSFIVVVDTPKFFQDLEPIESLKLPGRHVDLEASQLPLIGAYGKMLDYHTIHEVDQYVYASVENRRYNYDARHRNWQDKPLVDGGRYPSHPFVHEGAFFRLLGTEG
jgi:hypothetical protein